MIAPLRLCLAAGCSARVQRGYCGAHRAIVDQHRGNSHTRGYTRRWYNRARLFRARFPLCGMRPGGVAPVMSECHDAHRYTPAEQVDHVVPHRGDERLFWDELGNWQSLCARCGARKSQAGL